MISIEHEGQTVILEGNASDFAQLQKHVNLAADPAHKAQVVFRVLDEVTGNHVNLILRKGQSRDSL